MFFILAPVVTVWAYGAITTYKYLHYRDKLDNRAEREDADAIGMYAAAWPLAVFFEPREYRGLLYPSLYMWPRFREEWPTIKASEEGDQRRLSELRRREKRRKRDEKFGNLTLEDARAEVAHAKAMEVLRRDTEVLQQQFIDDHPPAIEEGERYDPATRRVVKDKNVLTAKETVVEPGHDVYCTRHRHFVTLSKINDPSNTCTDIAPYETY